MPSSNLRRRLLVGAATTLAASASLATTAMLAPTANAAAQNTAVQSAATKNAGAPHINSGPHCGGRLIDRYTTPGVGPVFGQNMGTVNLYFDGTSNCAYFERSGYDRGYRLPIEFSMTVGNRSVHDNGDYLYYAGPLTLPGRDQCVTLAVRERVNQHMLVDWHVGPVHCGH